MTTTTNTETHCTDPDAPLSGSIEHAAINRETFTLTSVVEDSDVFIMINGTRVGRVSVEWAWRSPMETHAHDCDVWDNEESTCEGFLTVSPEVSLTLHQEEITNDTRTYVRTMLW